MRRCVRVVVVVLLVALPFQAFAAASMFFCSLGAHDSDEVHPLRIVDGELLTIAIAEHDADHHRLKHLADSCGSCGECCCPSTLIAEITTVVFPPDSRSAAIPYIERPFSGAVPERLDRPPRTNLV